MRVGRFVAAVVFGLTAWGTAAYLVAALWLLVRGG